MIDLKPYYQVKLHLLIYKASFFYNPPKTEDENTPMTLFKKRIGSMRKEAKCLISKRIKSC